MPKYPGLAFADEAAKATMTKAQDDGPGEVGEDNSLSAQYAARARQLDPGGMTQGMIAQIGVQQTPSLEELVKANGAVLASMEIELSRIETFERRVSGTDGMVSSTAMASEMHKASPDTLVARLWQQNTQLVRLYQELRAVRGRLDRVHS